MNTMEQITIEGLATLIKDNFFEDLDRQAPDSNRYRSQEFGIYAELSIRSEHLDSITINKHTYDTLLAQAEGQGNMPVYICHTPLGIWQFNLALITPTEDKTVLYLDMNKATPLLPWYPDYKTEDEWIADEMVAYAEHAYVDPHELELEDFLAMELDSGNPWKVIE